MCLEQEYFSRQHFLRQKHCLSTVLGVRYCEATESSRKSIWCVRADKPSLSWAHFRQMSACSVFFIENIPGSPNDVETLDSAERPIEQLKFFQNTGDGLNLLLFWFA